MSTQKIIYDQDDAVDEVVDALIHISCRPEEAQPRGIFTFLGSDAVGKTYLARSLAKFLEGYSYVIHLDMEQYGDPESILQLLGGKGVLEGAQEGDLLRSVREHPRSIIIFEGIEKADNQLHLALLCSLKKILQDLGLWETRNHDPPICNNPHTPEFTYDDAYSQIPPDDYFLQ